MNEIRMIPVRELHPHPDNPRKDLGDLTELADSIRTNGVLQNLTVIPGRRATEEELKEIRALYDSLAGDNPVEANAKAEILEQIEDRWTATDYTVVIGHRRLAAAQLAGLQELPCVVAKLDHREQVRTMLLENMQRSDLTVYEQAQGFQMMLDLGATVEEIAAQSGFSEATVRRRVKMTELDQKLLREVSDRQLSLGDFDALAKIENIDRRNECLAVIGTRDFEFSVSKAMKEQNVKKNLPAVRQWLKEQKAEKITSTQSWSNEYDMLGGWLYVAKWGEEGNRPPKKLPAKLYYVLDNDSLRLYKKHEKAKPAKKPAKKPPEEKAVAEAWKSLEETAALAHGLRRAFVEKLTVTKKNREAVLRGGLLAGLLSLVCYNSGDREAVRPVFGIEKGYDGKRDVKLADGLVRITGEALPGLVYALFGDMDRSLPVESTYRGVFPQYGRSVKLEILYGWLESLGYEAGTEEASLLDGTHEAFRAEEAFEAGGGEAGG